MWNKAETESGIECIPFIQFLEKKKLTDPILWEKEGKRSKIPTMQFSLVWSIFHSKVIESVPEN